MTICNCSELLGEVNYSELLDAEVLSQLRSELQRLNTQYPVRSVDGLHDLLLYLGDLSRVEVSDRCDLSSDPQSADNWIASLLDQGRIIQLSIADEERFVAAEDAARYRDALSIQLPSGIAAALLEPVESPLVDLVSRFGRTHGPFSKEDVGARFGLPPDQVNGVLVELGQNGRLISGDFTTPEQDNEQTSTTDKQWCDANVLRIWKQRSLALVRQQIKPASPEVCTRFLIDWHGIGRRRNGPEALLDVVEQLQGIALPASCLERDILPARLPDYRPGELDELCSTGEALWQGRGKHGTHDGRIALFLSESFDQQTLPPPADEVEDELADRIRDFLTSNGAVFFSAIHSAVGGFRNDVFDTLWRLVWNGEITNDTLAPVRSLNRSTRSTASSRSGQTPTGRRTSSRRSGRARSQRAALLPGTEGRWSLLSTPEEGTFSPTERRMEQTQQLLDRMGIVTRESVTAENIAGGFSAIYPILRALEDSGKIRRGYFIEGLGAAQFAAPERGRTTP